MNGKAIASVILGLVSFFVSWIGFLTGVVGLVLGIMAVREPNGGGLAITGIVISGLSVFLNILLIIFGVAFLGFLL
ncbi:hypothetical protein DH09_10530 [Bacillaceae bacterium JMAK1]|nr:hypothetical protein DH09_10530 [Bacillaceae bacterium JMAK1]